MWSYRIGRPVCIDCGKRSPVVPRDRLARAILRELAEEE